MGMARSIKPSSYPQVVELCLTGTTQIPLIPSPSIGRMPTCRTPVASLWRRSCTCAKIHKPGQMLRLTWLPMQVRLSGSSSSCIRMALATIQVCTLTTCVSRLRWGRQRRRLHPLAHRVGRPVRPSQSPATSARPAFTSQPTAASMSWEDAAPTRPEATSLTRSSTPRAPTHGPP